VIYRQIALAPKVKRRTNGAFRELNSGPLAP